MIDRRTFLFGIAGLVMGGTGAAVVHPLVHPRTEFPPEEILEIDEDGKVHRQWRMTLIPDDPDGEVLTKKMPVIGDDPAGLIEKFGLEWRE